MINFRYITVSQLARKSNLPKAYLKRLAKANKIPSLNINGRLRFNSEAVQQALDELAAKGGDNE
jgi:excisionase family DNA binding protein